LEVLMIGVFALEDLFLFYVFFEAGLIPMFLIIGIWGGKEPRLRLVQVLPLHAARLGADADRHHGDVLAGRHDRYPELLPMISRRMMQTWLWLAFFASFAVKMPMWPVHTWLPDAHVQAPTAGSVILAGVLLKLGGYGFLRFSLPMFPEASEYFAPMVFALSVVAIIYTSLVALMQSDIKKLIAYSSVAHMGYRDHGYLRANTQGVQGAIFQMLSHGIVSGALFLCVGVVYDRTAHPRDRGLWRPRQQHAEIRLAFMVFTMANVGLPGTSRLRRRIPDAGGMYRVSTSTLLIGTTGIILGAAYMLYLYRRVVIRRSHQGRCEARCPIFRPARVRHARCRSPRSPCGWASIRRAS
jgi:NADH-quinone oxidoreductase subunit M